MAGVQMREGVSVQQVHLGRDIGSSAFGIDRGAQIGEILVIRQRACLLEQNCVAILTPQPVVKRIAQEPPRIFDAPSR